MTDGVVRYRVVVTGRVQGVWYRESCRRTAERLGVGGWVRNRPDGSVEAAVEGPPAAVDRLLDWMREGPPRAVVEKVDPRLEDPAGDRAFVVR
ncbi:MAG TPA: acylphosphatase [Acidimicrobiales bacterium]